MKRIQFIYITTLMLILAIGGCAGPNPNIGERTADMAWTSGRYYDAVKTIRPHAESGEPWAQLRMGIMYENGWSVIQDIPLAIEWYKRAAKQKANGAWAEGIMIGATGPSGYFNQNSDARIAQINIANLYLKGEGIEKDLEQSYLNIRTVIDELEARGIRGIFFCCEFAGGRYFTHEMITNIYDSILKEMSQEEREKAEDLYLKMRNRK